MVNWAILKFWNPAEFRHFLGQLSNGANPHPCNSGSKKRTEVLAITGKEDIGPRPKRGGQNWLVLGRQGVFRTSADACGDLQFAKERIESGHPVRLFC